ncbi:unnamed protein product [Amoebophrya sp. A120]|nr:unnamed protein product [Amoebophrya sp. A120]|eukprot:GSA120T00000536001.1
MKMFVEKLTAVLKADQHFNEHWDRWFSWICEHFWTELRRISQETSGTNSFAGRGFQPFRTLELLEWELAERIGLCLNLDVVPGSERERIFMPDMAEKSKRQWIVVTKGYTDRQKGRWIKVPNIPKIWRHVWHHAGNLKRMAKLVAPPKENKDDPNKKNPNISPGGPDQRTKTQSTPERYKAAKANELIHAFDDPGLRILQQHRLQKTPLFLGMASLSSPLQDLLLCERVFSAWEKRKIDLRNFEDLQENVFCQKISDFFLTYLLKVEAVYYQKLTHFARFRIENNDQKMMTLFAEKHDLDVPEYLNSFDAENEFRVLFNDEDYIYKRLCSFEKSVCLKNGLDLTIGSSVLSPHYHVEAVENYAVRAAILFRKFLNSWLKLLEEFVVQNPGKLPGRNKTRLHHPVGLFDAKMFLSHETLEKIAQLFRRLLVLEIKGRPEKQGLEQNRRDETDAKSGFAGIRGVEQQDKDKKAAAASSKRASPKFDDGDTDPNGTNRGMDPTSATQSAAARRPRPPLRVQYEKAKKVEQQAGEVCLQRGVLTEENLQDLHRAWVAKNKARRDVVALLARWSGSSSGSKMDVGGTKGPERQEPCPKIAQRNYWHAIETGNAYQRLFQWVQRQAPVYAAKRRRFEQVCDEIDAVKEEFIDVILEAQTYDFGFTIPTVPRWEHYSTKRNKNDAGNSTTSRSTTTPRPVVPPFCVAELFAKVEKSELDKTLLDAIKDLFQDVQRVKQARGMYEAEIVKLKNKFHFSQELPLLPKSTTAQNKTSTPVLEKEVEKGTACSSSTNSNSLLAPPRILRAEGPLSSEAETELLKTVKLESPLAFPLGCLDGRGEAVTDAGDQQQDLIAMNKKALDLAANLPFLFLPKLGTPMAISCGENDGFVADSCSEFIIPQMINVVAQEQGNKRGLYDPNKNYSNNNKIISETQKRLLETQGYRKVMFAEDPASSSNTTEEGEKAESEPEPKPSGTTRDSATTKQKPPVECFLHEQAPNLWPNLCIRTDEETGEEYFEADPPVDQPDGSRSLAPVRGNQLRKDMTEKEIEKMFFDRGFFTLPPMTNSRSSLSMKMMKKILTKEDHEMRLQAFSLQQKNSSTPEKLSAERKEIMRKLIGVSKIFPRWILENIPKVKARWEEKREIFEKVTQQNLQYQKSLAAEQKSEVEKQNDANSSDNKEDEDSRMKKAPLFTHKSLNPELERPAQHLYPNHTFVKLEPTLVDFLLSASNKSTEEKEMRERQKLLTETAAVTPHQPHEVLGTTTQQTEVLPAASVGVQELADILTEPNWTGVPDCSSESDLEGREWDEDRADSPDTFFTSSDASSI